MKKSSTLSRLHAESDNNEPLHRELTYSDESLFESAGNQGPRRSTIDRIRQFARVACCVTLAGESTLLILN